MSDVVELIDELIAEQKCWHCERSFHRLPLTKRVAAMFDRGHIDSDYFASEDTTPIVCDGSTFIGPIRPKPTFAGGLIGPGWASLYGGMGLMQNIVWPKVDLTPFVQSMTALSFKFAEWSITVGGKQGLGAKPFAPWVIFDEWKEPEPVCAGPVPDVDVEFGPQNWQPREPVAVPAAVSTAVVQRWQHFAKPEPIPVPTSGGYDFTAFQGDEPKYPTSKKGKK